MMTRAGAQVGYSLETVCREPDCFGVDGIGSQNAYPGANVSDEPSRVAAIKRWQAKVLTALEGVHSIDLSADGQGCKRAGIEIWMHSWLEVDDAIAKVGRLIVSEQSSDEITICVRPGGFGALHAN